MYLKLQEAMKSDERKTKYSKNFHSLGVKHNYSMRLKVAHCKNRERSDLELKGKRDYLYLGGSQKASR
jgi:hypothetical protein